MALLKETIGVGFLSLMLLGYGSTPAIAEDAQKLLLHGDVALWTVAIKPDKTAQFELVLSKLRTALQTSDKPERQRQGKSWKVLRLSTPLPGGNVAYVHMIEPPVPDVDYSVTQILYEAFPDEARTLYDQYREAFAANLALATGDIVINLSEAP